MKWNYQIGVVARIPVVANLSWILWIGGLVALVAICDGVAAGAGAFALFAAVFASVTYHELAHALVGRRYGLETSRIVLLPIGGCAEMAGLASNVGRAELSVAAAGPVSSAFLAGLLYGLYWALPGSQEALWLLFQVNLFLCLFNLLPLIPLDGGRILRSLLTGSDPSDRALLRGTTIAAWVSWIGSVVMVGGACEGLWSLWLIILGLFVGLGGFGELDAARSLVRARRVARRLREIEQQHLEDCAEFAAMVGEVTFEVLRRRAVDGHRPHCGACETLPGEVDCPRSDRE